MFGAISASGPKRLYDEYMYYQSLGTKGQVLESYFDGIHLVGVHLLLVLIEIGQRHLLAGPVL